MRTAASFLVAVALAAPLLSQPRYYKGNTHTHSYPQSSDADPAWTGAAAASFYKTHGYDFIVFTDHGAWWNAGPLSAAGFLVISGEEAGISGFGRWGHFTAMPLTNRVSGAGLTHQQLIDLIVSSGAMAFVNHPRYSAIPLTAVHVIDSMQRNLMHMEIWNGTTVSQPGPDDISVWDSVLATGRQIYGVASDDAHREGHALKGWIMVRSNSLAQDSILSAIRNGNFYASTGIVFDSIAYTVSSLSVWSSNATQVRFIGKGGQTLSTIQSGQATYVAWGDEIYVRAEASNAAGERGWTQPLMITAPTGVGEEPASDGHGPRKGIEVYRHFPDPVNPTTTVRFSLPSPSDVQLAVYDILGREVRLHQHGLMQEGVHDITIDAGGLSSGVYHYVLQAGTDRTCRKMIVLK